MPARKPPTREVDDPGRNRRRIWTRPTLASHSFLVLTADQLYLAAEGGEPNAELLALIQNGADLNDTIGSQALVIDLVTVRRLKLDLLNNSLLVEHTESGDGTTEQQLTFATPEAADACFSKIWRRLGDGLHLAPYERDRWSLARGPVLLLVGTLLATAVLTLILSILADSGPPPPDTRTDTSDGSPRPRVLLRKLDWRVVCGIGGVIAAVSQVWLYRRLTSPPAVLELNRT